MFDVARAAADETLKPQDFFLDKEAYTSKAFAELEAKRLWPRVWQVACREEEIPHVGDFVTYDIVNESIIVVRTSETEIKAFHNVCMHRGRRLTEGCGTTTQFMCRFHAWRWNLNGENTQVVDVDDWGDTLKPEDVALRTVQVGTWGGFVFVNMDKDPMPFDEYMKVVDDHCGKLEFEKLRYRWRKSVVFPCNWKVALEAFDESYHVQGTHKQFLEWMEDYSVSGAFGLHSAFWFPQMKGGESRFGPSFRLNKPRDKDVRKYLMAYYKEMHEELGAMVTPRTYEAVQKVMTDLPDNATATETLLAARQFAKQAAIDDGAGWPDVTDDYIAKSLSDWHVFPNLIFLHQNVDGIIAYRSRPNGEDPNSCIFDVYSLVRYAPGKEPKPAHEFYEDWRDLDCGRILLQDFANMADVQKGMRSSYFPGPRINPVQEQAIANFHRVIRKYVES